VLGIEIALLVAAFFALSLVIGFAWVSVQSLSGDSPLTLDEALTLGQPSVEEEQKRAVLRALKDLDYERSVGKISDQDYHELSARYREEAKRLIERVDESLTPARERAEKLLAERVERDKERALEREKREAAELEAAKSPKDDASDDETEGPPSTAGKKAETDEAETDEAKKDEEERA
jgi:hypothetical protein